MSHEELENYVGQLAVTIKKQDERIQELEDTLLSHSHGYLDHDSDYVYTGPNTTR